MCTDRERGVELGTSKTEAHNLDKNLSTITVVAQMVLLLIWMCRRSFIFTHRCTESDRAIW